MLVQTIQCTEGQWSEGGVPLEVRDRQTALDNKTEENGRNHE
jgi:hypothetical protein